MPASRRIALVLALAAAGSGSVRALEPERGAATELSVKAGFLYNFMKFVEWPRGTALGDEAVLRIGVVGDDALAAELERVLRGKKVQGKSLAVRRFASIAAVRPCQILYVAPDEAPFLAELLGSLHGAPVLTVSQAPGFALAGGTVNFFDDERHLRFEINPAAAERVGLKISSHMLGLARIVRE